LFYNTSSYYDASVAICDVVSNPGECSYVFIYNNTFVDIDNASITWNHNDGANNCIAENNLYYGNTTIAFTGTDHDYNAFETTENESHEQIGITSSIFENYSSDNFHLSTHTTSGHNIGAPYNYDMTGKLRSSWDRGAYEYTNNFRILININ
jgi:hypothetical protein